MNKNQIDQVVSLVFGDTEDSVKAVDHVFAVLAATYGAAWDRALGAAPIGDVKTAWAFQLSQFTHSQAAKRSILWALKNPLDSVPSSIQFRNLCRAAPGIEALQLPAPKADPEVILEEIAKQARLKSTKTKGSHGENDWAYRLKSRHDAGEKLSPFQVKSYQEVVGACA